MRKNENIDKFKESGEITQISAQCQPPAELKKLGWAKKKLLREVLQCKVPQARKLHVEELARLFGITPAQLTIELAMHLAQIEKAIKGDTGAYKTLMERALRTPCNPACK